MWNTFLNTIQMHRLYILYMFMLSGLESKNLAWNDVLSCRTYLALLVLLVFETNLSKIFQFPEVTYGLLLHVWIPLRKWWYVSEHCIASLHLRTGSHTDASSSSSSVSSVHRSSVSKSAQGRRSHQPLHTLEMCVTFIFSWTSPQVHGSESSLSSFNLISHNFMKFNTCVRYV
jgi:hypothetical protein